MVTLVVFIIKEMDKKIESIEAKQVYYNYIITTLAISPYSLQKRRKYQYRYSRGSKYC
jgi:hypothetical protein